MKNKVLKVTFLRKDSKMYHECNKNVTKWLYLCSVNRLIVITILTCHYLLVTQQVIVVFDLTEEIYPDKITENQSIIS